MLLAQISLNIILFVYQHGWPSKVFYENMNDKQLMGDTRFSKDVKVYPKAIGNEQTKSTFGV